MTRTYTKPVASRLDYEMDWSRWLKNGDTITSAAATVDESELVVDDIEWTGAVVTIWLVGGTLWESYRVTCSITTAQGRTDSREFRVRVEPRQLV